MNNVGYTPQSSATVLANVQTAYTNTFGDGFILSPSSINGQMIQFNTLAAIEVEDAKTILYGSLYNPNLAYGIWLDSICKFNNITRKPATQSVVAILCTGLAGTIIGVNSKITSDNNDIFYNKEVIVIGSSGVATGTFYSEQYGLIPCNAGTINQIVTTVAGWDTVNNPADGTVGTLEESDQNLRNRRKYSLAINSAGSVNSVIAALNENVNILNFGVQENPLDLAQVIQGVTIQPHCIYVSIYTNYTDEIKNQIANILFSKRYCTMQGNTSWTITDSEYSHVTFLAKWQTAVAAPVRVDITIQNSTAYPSNIADLIKAAVVANWNGEFTGIAKYRMQDVVNVSRFYPSLIALGVYQINAMTIQLVTGGTAAASVFVSLDKVMTLSATNVNVTIAS